MHWPAPKVMALGVSVESVAVKVLGPWTVAPVPVNRQSLEVDTSIVSVAGVSTAVLPIELLVFRRVNATLAAGEPVPHLS